MINLDIQAQNHIILACRMKTRYWILNIKCCDSRLLALFACLIVDAMQKMRQRRPEQGQPKTYICSTVLIIHT